MTQEPISNYWIDVAVAEIITARPEGELVVSSGISPSASYHIGHYREILTAEALAWGLRRAGRKVHHLHIVDNFDPLRKWYDFLPPAKRDYSGWPLALIPSPIDDGSASYADHFYKQFGSSLESMGIGGNDFTVIRSYEELYANGRMAFLIKKVIESGEEIRRIYATQFKRELAVDWLPVVYIGGEGKFIKAVQGDYNSENQTIAGIPLNDGRVKLDWRLDWPARWSLLGVNVEPFGAQEHGAAGSSYDTGSVFARQIFNIEPPYGKVRYGHIHRPGEQIKMSSSKGNGITPAQALSIMPSQVLRYVIVRSRPENKIIFDPGMGFIDLMDEFAVASQNSDHEFRDAYLFAADGNLTPIVSAVPFGHLAAVWQAAQYDGVRALEILERTGHRDAVNNERQIILNQFAYVDGWIKSFAPPKIIFTLQNEMPEVELSNGQKKFLSTLANLVEAGIDDGQAMHEAIYGAREDADIKPNEAFAALYKTILGQDFGPKAGWFLSSLDPAWLVNRLRLEK